MSGGSEICSSFTFSHAYFLAYLTIFRKPSLAWDGDTRAALARDTGSHKSQRFEEKLCVEYEALRGAYCEKRDGESWDTEILRCHTQQAHEDYPSQPCGISHFSQIILAYELRTADLQDLDLSISWAPLELSRVTGTQSGSGIQRKNIGTALAWPGDVRTWGLSPYIMCELLTTLSHCATPGHSGVIITEAIVSWVSSSPCRMSRPWPGSTQQGHTSHIAAMTWTGGRNTHSSGYELRTQKSH